LGTRRHPRIVDGRIEEMGFDSTAHSTHSMRRIKPALVHRRTDKHRAVQLFLGHTKLEGTVRYPGIQVNDALEMAEQTEARVIASSDVRAMTGS
jgi:peptidoglycan/xylan/chitin deacetylase (PgdA/CDA1 family)